MIRKSLSYLLFFISAFNDVQAQVPNIILGRPTDQSITLSLLSDRNWEGLVEYGTIPGRYDSATIWLPGLSEKPMVKDLVKLKSDQQYYYRVRYRFPPDATVSYSPEYSFHTQRKPGSSFTFTIESDEHLYDKKGVRNMYQVVLNNQAADRPDFMLSLGDTFGDDHYPTSISSQELAELHYDYRPYLGTVCHSIPFFFCLGNHEGENSYYLNINPPNNLGVQGTLWRKYYYPNPYPNSFYSGNTQQEPNGIGYPENYYAWHWGDALFVVLDVYRYQDAKDPKPQEWDWSLGRAQYDWLKATLSGSTAKYKFVFAHHIRGQGRGGVTNSKLYEWGGMNGDGRTYGFDTYRPGWGKPIHDMFREYGVNIFFQGHDHLFAQEVRDNVVYQAVPMGADSTYEIGMLANAYAYLSNTVMGTGHIRVQVNPDCVNVDFIRAWLPKDTDQNGRRNGETAFSYQVGSCSVTSTLNPMVGDTPQVRIFPNPASDIIQLSSTNRDAISDAVLYDIRGRWMGRFVKGVLDVKNLSPGRYLIRYIYKGKSYSSSVMIAR